MYDNGRHFLGVEAVVREGEGVGADGEIHKIVAADAVGFLCARESRGVGDGGDSSVGDGAARRIGHHAGDAAKSLLRKDVGRETKNHAAAEKYCTEEKEFTG